MSMIHYALTMISLIIAVETLQNHAAPWALVALYWIVVLLKNIFGRE